MCKSGHREMTRPFRILGVQQIAIGGRDKALLRKLWLELLGLELVATKRIERENVDEDIARAGSGEFAVEVDLMQPIDADKKPAVHEPPLNHVGLWVDDLRAALQQSTDRPVLLLVNRQGSSLFVTVRPNNLRQ